MLADTVYRLCRLGMYSCSFVSGSALANGSPLGAVVFFGLAVICARASWALSP